MKIPSASRVAPGTVRRIDSPSNPRIRAIKALAMKKRREADGIFMAEGLKLLADALDSGWVVRTVLFSPSEGDSSVLMEQLARARARGAEILKATPKALRAASKRDNPQSVIAVYESRWGSFPRSPSADSFWIALDRARDPGNLGAIVRTADCVGAEGVALIGECADPFGPEASRASMGSLFHVPVARMSAESFVEACSSWPGEIIGTHLSGTLDYRQPARGDALAGKPLLLVMGNERYGLAPELAGACSLLCRIPMRGKADSLNLAVSTGIMAYELLRHRLGADGDGRGGEA